MSYLIGMDIKKNEMLIDLCQNPIQSNCFLNWRSFLMNLTIQMTGIMEKIIFL